MVVAGFLSDVLGARGRSLIVFFGLLFTGTALLLLASRDWVSARDMAVWLTALIAFMLIGPFSFLAGAMSMEFGGKQGSATASGLVDGIGYIGGILAGNAFAGISVKWGWAGAFGALALVAFLSTGAAAIILWRERSKGRSLTSLCGKSFDASNRTG